MVEVIQEQPSKETWKKQVDKAIHEHWAKEISTVAAQKSSIKFLNQSFIPNEPHFIWEATTTDPKDICRAVVKARILSG